MKLKESIFHNFPHSVQSLNSVGTCGEIDSDRLGSTWKMLKWSSGRSLKINDLNEGCLWCEIGSHMNTFSKIANTMWNNVTTLLIMLMFKKSSPNSPKIGPPYMPLTIKTQLLLCIIKFIIARLITNLFEGVRRVLCLQNIEKYIFYSRVSSNTIVLKIWIFI